MNDQTPPRGPAKGRSPSYPGISLKTAVKRAEELHKESKGHPLPLPAITKAWGYKSPTTGPASVTYSALKKFGLIQDEGVGTQRIGQLTDLALDILLSPEPGPFLKQAALKPPIHREMWEEYGADLPGESALKYELVRNRGFTESGFSDFIRGYKETIALAQLSDSDRFNESGDAESEDKNGKDSGREDSGRGRELPKRPDAAAGVLTIPVALPGAQPIIVEGTFPVSEAAWAQFIAVLQAMKPGLVSEPANSQSESE